MKLSPLHFQLSIIVIKKRLPDSASRRLPDSASQRVAELANKTILGYSCGLQSSLYTKNQRFTFKALIFGPKKSVEFYRKSIDKSDKSSEDINVG
jgi:hypothetical protein